MTITLQQRIRALLEDPAASSWLKRALEGALCRDPVDAVNDAEVLAALLVERADQALGNTVQPQTPHDPTLN